MRTSAQMSFFSIQTVLGNNLPNQKKKEIIEQLAIIFLDYIELLEQPAIKTEKETSHVK
jgi:hypothetical protein